MIADIMAISKELEKLEIVQSFYLSGIASTPVAWLMDIDAA